MRLPALDLARTIAIIGMIIYHTAYDLQVFYGYGIDVFSGAWKLGQTAVAALFLLLVGVSFAVANARYTDRKARWKKAMRRCGVIGGAAALVSIATYVMDSETFVRFGILHLIAVSSLILPFIASLKERSVFPGLILLFLGPVIRSMTTDNPLLIPFGIRTEGFRTVDYFPLVPWLGVILIGYAMGHWIYIRHAQAPIATRHRRWQQVLTWPGRHSLAIYLLHQPLILAVLWMSNIEN